MQIPIAHEMSFAWLQQQRLGEAKSDRLADLARQHANAQRVGVGDSQRKDIESR